MPGKIYSQEYIFPDLICSELESILGQNESMYLRWLTRDSMRVHFKEGGGGLNIHLFLPTKIGHRKKMYHNGETSISTVPCGCACQVFESILHNCDVRLAFPLYLRCPFLNGFCTHLKQRTYATTNYAQSSSELTASFQTCLYHVENCHPQVDSNPRPCSPESDALTN